MSKSNDPVFVQQTGEVAAAITATQLPSREGKWVMFQGHATNTGYIWVGLSGVTVRDGSTDTTTGFFVAPGEWTPPIPIRNLDDLYAIGTSTSDSMSYIVMG